MAAKMAVYHKKYKKIFPETDKVQGFACKMLILLIVELHTSSLWSQWSMLSFSIWHIQDGVQDRSQQIFQPVGAAPYMYQMPLQTHISE